MILPLPNSSTHSQASAASLIYSCVCCSSSAATGVCLVYYSLGSSSHSLVDGGHPVKYLSLVTGLILLALVAEWATLSVLSCKISTYFSASCKSDQQQPNPPSSTLSCILSLMWILFLLLLILSILLEISLTGLLWWTSHQLGLQYRVIGNCFCVVEAYDHSNEEVVDMFGLNCPQLDGLTCPAVYRAIPVQMGEGMIMDTRQCTRVDGRGIRDDCLLFSSFWSWFKIWRILLPTMIVVKLPITFICCYSFVSMLTKKKVEEQPIISYNTESNTVTLDNYPPLPSPVQVDPVKFYNNICAGLDEPRNTQEPTEVMEQEQCQELTSLASKPATLRATATMARFPSSSHVPIYCTASLTPVQCPVPPPPPGPYKVIDEKGEVAFTQDDSPPNIQEHIISTPIETEKSTMTPQFDLSKVLKPIFNMTATANINEDNSVQSVYPISQTKLAPEVFDFEPHKNLQYSKQEQAYMRCKTRDFPSNNPSVSASLTMQVPSVPTRTSSLASPRPISSVWCTKEHVQARPNGHNFTSNSLHPRSVRSQRSSNNFHIPTHSPPKTRPSMLLPVPPARSSSISSKSSSIAGGSGNPAPSQVSRLPPTFIKPPRVCSDESSNEFKTISVAKEREEHHASEFPPPVDYLDGISRINVVVDDPSDSDLDSSTCDSTTPIVRKSTEQKPGKVWPISSAPLMMRRGSTSAVVPTSPGTNIQEICRRARNMSQSSNVDWSKLP